MDTSLRESLAPWSSDERGASGARPAKEEGIGGGGGELAGVDRSESLVGVPPDALSLIPAKTPAMPGRARAPGGIRGSSEDTDDAREGGPGGGGGGGIEPVEIGVVYGSGMPSPGAAIGVV